MMMQKFVKASTTKENLSDLNKIRNILKAD